MIQGKVTEVSINPIGDEAVNVHTVGETEIRLYDATDFDEVGGKVKVGADVYTYTSKSDDLDTLYLDVTTPLVTAIAEGDKVYLEPYGEEKVAQVTLELGEDAILAIVPHNIQDRLRDGIRDTDAQETVYCEKIEGVWYIREVSSELPSIDGWYIDPNTLPDPETPTDPPASSPDPIVTGGPDFFVIRSANQASSWAQANIEYHVTIDGSVPTAGDAATKLGETKGVLVAKKLPDGSDFSVGVDYHFRAIAKNVVGYGPVSNDMVARLDTAAVENIVASEIVAGFILTGRIQIGQSYIDANDGVVLPQPDGTTTRFPVDGVTPATISGFLIANGMTMKDGAYFYGLTQLIGEFRINAGVPNPGNAPQVSFFVPTAPNAQNYGDNHTISTTGKLVGIGGWTRTNPLPVINDSSAYISSVTTGLEEKLVYLDNNFLATGITRIDSIYYVIGKDKNRSDNWYIYKFDAATLEGAADNGRVFKTGEVFFANTNNLRYRLGPVTFSGGNKYVAITWISGYVSPTNQGTLNVQLRVADTLALRKATTVIASGLSGISDVLSAASPGGSPTYFLCFTTSGTIIPKVLVCSYSDVNNTWTAGLDTAREFTPEGTPYAHQGLAFDTQQRPVIVNSQRAYQYSTNEVAVAGLQAKYTWVDADAGGTGTHETAPSPANAAVTWPVRKWARITCNPAPHAGVVDPTQLDKANRIKVYYKTTALTQYQKSSDHPADGMVDGQNILEIQGVARTSDLPPTVTNFDTSSVAPGSVESSLEDGSGPMIKLSGSGDWRLGELSAGTTGLLTGDSARLGKYAKTVTDWNTATMNGWYMATGATNAPSTGWFIGQVIAHNSAWCTQILHAFAANDLYSPVEWRRELNNGTWSDWFQISLNGRVSKYESTSTASIPNSAFTTVVGWTAVTNGGIFDTGIASGALTIEYDGTYLINAGVSFGNNTTGRRVLAIFHGSDELGRVEAAPAAPAWTGSVSCLASLTAGDTISVRVFQTSGAGLALINTPAHRLELTRLGTK